MTITVNNREYLVTTRETVEDLEKQGSPLLAPFMRSEGISARLTMLDRKMRAWVCFEELQQRDGAEIVHYSRPFLARHYLQGRRGQ